VVVVRTEPCEAARGQLRSPCEAFAWRSAPPIGSRVTPGLAALRPDRHSGRPVRNRAAHRPWAGTPVRHQRTAYRATPCRSGTLTCSRPGVTRSRVRCPRRRGRRSGDRSGRLGGRCGRFLPRLGHAFHTVFLGLGAITLCAAARAVSVAEGWEIPASWVLRVGLGGQQVAGGLDMAAGERGGAGAPSPRGSRMVAVLRRGRDWS